MEAAAEPNAVYMACVPHVPFLVLQDRELNRPFWDAYERQVESLRAFNPDVVFVFGADHYSAQHLRLMPPFAIGMRAEAIGDDGGFPGPLDVPMQTALGCAEYLIDREFDVATSYAMEVDHGFSNVIHHFLGSNDAWPVVPVFINALCNPRPTFRRCRKFGDAIGSFAATLGQRVAFLGSGGLSHDTTEILPQFDTAPSETIRDYIVHGGAKGDLTRERWLDDLHGGLQVVNQMLLDRVPGVGSISESWDRRFLDTFVGDLREFDSWTDEEVTREGGNSAGEVRQWIAAAAAAKAAGASDVVVDHCSHDLPMGVAAAVVHA